MNPTTANTNTNSSQYFQNIIADIAEKNRIPDYEKGLMSYYKLERRAVVEFYRLKHQEGLTHSQAKVALKEMAQMRSMAAAAERLSASSTAHHQFSPAPRVTPHNAARLDTLHIDGNAIFGDQPRSAVTDLETRVQILERELSEIKLALAAEKQCNQSSF